MRSMWKVMLSVDVKYIYSNLSITVAHHIFQILAYTTYRCYTCMYFKVTIYRVTQLVYDNVIAR